MPTLPDITPTKQHCVIDLVREAGLDVVNFDDGYSPNATGMLVELRGLRRCGTGSGAYAISLGRVIGLKRWRRMS